jgi:hypothetical protein
MILSLLFLCNPVKNGLIHTIDAFFARVSVICFVKKNSSLVKIIFYTLFLIGIFMFLCGDKESSKNHMCFHLFLSLVACFAF